MASVGGSLTWEAEDLVGELFRGAGVGAAGHQKMSQTWRRAEEGCYFRVRGSANRRGSYASWWMVSWT